MQPLPPICYDPPKAPLEVIHADQDVLAVSKPAGLLSVPGKGAHLSDCLLARVEMDFPEARLVHRLDMDTSGIMIFARNPDAQRHLGLQFERRHCRKHYLARVAGVVTQDAGDIDLPLIADWPNRPLQKVCFETGKTALTSWSIAQRAKDTTLLNLFPHTGRSHQLRIHLKETGHPILGDRFYGGLPAPRLMLHAWQLTVRHPDGGMPLTLTASPDTPDLKTLAD